MKKFMEWHEDQECSAFGILLFSVARKANRDRIGIWKIQAWLSVYIWLQLLSIPLVITASVCGAS